eukprot:CAMPEP_0178753090 /NCGR_PEP_ID=MMETSP0744-20121128/11423_1 /TAXON_ID=913974 /ORGANISM="Nitzschia punctata, Strain CCMP561" /LENGTH=177 /DNA_ID=CAMNT_0020406877 /DNA_START=22 /DNA_END=555 /DNA_ORIENTATION=+
MTTSTAKSEITTTDKQMLATPWDRMDPARRGSMVWWLWAVTWIGLVAGYLDDKRRGWDFVVVFSAAHTILFWGLFLGETSPFPVQVRLAYFLWVACGTLAFDSLMHITLVGLFANLTVGYCPLARMMSLLPWNRKKNIPLSWDLVRRTILSPPTEGRFEVVMDEAAAAAGAAEKKAA